MIMQLFRKISTSTQRKIINLIQNECCDYSSGDCNRIDRNCAQIQRLKRLKENSDLSIFACKWFHEAVLPLDEDLQSILLAPQDLKKCERCKVPFSAGSNRAKYCNSCVVVIRKKQKRESASRRRANL
jgi:hypothetical protein